MSVDEVAWQKWHKCVTNVVDIDKRLVIWNHPGRGTATLDKFYHDVGLKRAPRYALLPVTGRGITFNRPGSIPKRALCSRTFM
jgi:hypothetical protein